MIVTKSGPSKQTLVEFVQQARRGARSVEAVEHFDAILASLQELGELKAGRRTPAQVRATEAPASQRVARRVNLPRGANRPLTSKERVAAFRERARAAEAAKGEREAGTKPPRPPKPPKPPKP